MMESIAEDPYCLTTVIMGRSFGCLTAFVAVFFFENVKLVCCLLTGVQGLKMGKML